MPPEKETDPEVIRHKAAEASEALYGEPPAKPKKPKHLERPFPPEIVAKKFKAAVALYQDADRETMIGKMPLWQYARWQLAECFPGEEKAEEYAHSVSAYLTGKDSAAEWGGGVILRSF